MKKRNKIGFLVLTTAIATQVLPIGSIVSNAQQIEQNISTTEGKTISLSDNAIGVYGVSYNFYGQSLQQGFKLKFDMENRQINVTDGISMLMPQAIHPGYTDQLYFDMKLYGADGELKENLSMNGNKTPTDAYNNINGKSFKYGDYITLNHLESSNRLKIEGNIIGKDADLSNGVPKDFLSRKCFKITRYGLVEIDIHNILKDEITILGRQYVSGTQGFRIRFDMTTNRMIVDKFGVKHAKFNSRYKNKDYIKIELIKNGEVTDTVSLQGDEKVDEAIRLQEMSLSFGDQIRITHEESVNKIRVSGDVQYASESNMQDGLENKTVTFELTEDGLKEV